jgi:hypothetical protein
MPVPNLVLLDPDIRRAFRSERAVNEVLRLVIELRKVAARKRSDLVVLVEAAGVEPASEKARDEEPTCVSDSKFSGAASEPARAAAS